MPCEEKVSLMELHIRDNHHMGLGVYRHRGYEVVIRGGINHFNQLVSASCDAQMMPKEEEGRV